MKRKNKKRKHEEWELEKYSDKELINYVRENIITASEGNAYDGVRSIYPNMVIMLCREMIRRMEKYKKSMNSYRKKYYESENLASERYTPEQIRELARKEIIS